VISIDFEKKTCRECAGNIPFQTFPEHRRIDDVG